MAVALFGLVAYDLDHASMRKTYSTLLFYSVAFDLAWLFMWCTPIARNDSDIQGQWERDSFRNSIKWGLACSFIAFLMRLASLDAWRKARQFSSDSDFNPPIPAQAVAGGVTNGAQKGSGAGSGYGSL